MTQTSHVLPLQSRVELGREVAAERIRDWRDMIPSLEGVLPFNKRPGRCQAGRGGLADEIGPRVDGQEQRRPGALVEVEVPDEVAEDRDALADGRP